MATVIGKKLTIDGYTFDLSGDPDYENVQNKPSIEGTELEGDMTFDQLNLVPITNSEMEELLR